MKKTNTKKAILSTVLMLTALCAFSPKVMAEAFIPQSTLNAIGNEIGGNIKHDSDSLKYDRLERENFTNYDRYLDRNYSGTNGENTVIQGSPTPAGNIQRARVDELDTKGVFVNSIDVDPSEILSSEELQGVVSKYAGKNLFITDIQQMVDEINNLYAEKGFVTAKAYLPEQEVSNGYIHIGLIESRIGKVSIQDNRWTRSKYILDRIPDKSGELFDIVKLEKDVLDFNRYNEGVKLSANLKAGEAEGTTDIELSADESFPFHIMGIMDNMGRRSTGSLRGGPMLVADSLFHNRDKMSLGVYLSGGAQSPFFDYNIPVNRHDGRIGFSYSSTFAKVKWGAYTPLGIRSRSYLYSLYYTQPIVRKAGFELKGYGSLNYKRSWSTMDILPLELRWLGTTKDQVTSIDAGFNLRKDTKRGIWYLNQDAAMAIPIFDSKSSYFKYSGGMLRLHDFSHGVIGQLQTNYQIIPNSKDIPYLDQFQTGGMQTVRGYSEGILLGKNGYVTKAELMFPLLPRQITSPRSGEKIPFIGNYIKGAVFADHAGVFPYVKQDAYGGSYFLASVGMGLRVQLPGDLSARLYWGYP